MLRAVEFDNEVDCRRVKISDAVADGVSPIELHAEDLFSPQALPQMAFGVGRICPQGVSFALNPAIVREPR